MHFIISRTHISTANQPFYLCVQSASISISNVVVQSQVMSNSLQPRGLQHAMLICPPLSLRIGSNLCPLSQWCYLTGKGQFSFQSQKSAMPKNVQTTTQSYSLHASKVMLKTLQARFQQYMNQELPDVQAGFRKGRGTRDQIVYIS